jgi:hypothetical protein
MFLPAFAAAAGVGGQLFSRILSVVSNKRFFWDMRSNGLLPLLNLIFILQNLFPQVHLLQTADENKLTI